MKIEISARKRDTKGTGSSRRMRNDGRVPGILYGGEGGAVNIELDHKELHRHLQREAFHASILTLKLDGQSHRVLLRDVQMHPFRGDVIHVDFQRVDENKKIHMKVPLHFVNAEKSPGVKEQGGVPNHVINELDISCLPDDLPEFIEVDMGNLTVGHSIHVKDLAFPKGVQPVLHRGENPVVATIIVPAVVTEEEEAAAAEAVPAAGDVPTTEQAAPAKEGEEAAGGDKAAGKGEKVEKSDKADKKEKK